MTDPTPSGPDAERPAAAHTDHDGSDHDGSDHDGDGADVDVPLNRAARRGRGKAGQKPVPGHVGPRAAQARGGHAPRSHTKRRSG